jgi:hypothetical protein
MLLEPAAVFGQPQRVKDDDEQRRLAGGYRHVLPLGCAVERVADAPRFAELLLRLAA